MEDPDDQSDDQKRMDQASANMERESEQPHDYQDRSNRKQHISPSAGNPGSERLDSAACEDVVYLVKGWALLPKILAGQAGNAPW
jgi:hypothetical protein